jgi:hypothetical protein
VDDHIDPRILPDAIVPVDGGRVDRNADGAVRLARPPTPRLRGDRFDLAIRFQKNPVDFCVRPQIIIFSIDRVVYIPSEGAKEEGISDL